MTPREPQDDLKMTPRRSVAAAASSSSPSPSQLKLHHMLLFPLRLDCLTGCIQWYKCPIGKRRKKCTETHPSFQINIEMEGLLWEVCGGAFSL